MLSIYNSFKLAALFAIVSAALSIPADQAFAQDPCVSIIITGEGTGDTAAEAEAAAEAEISNKLSQIFLLASQTGVTVQSFSEISRNCVYYGPDIDLNSSTPVSVQVHQWESTFGPVHYKCTIEFEVVICGPPFLVDLFLVMID